jgi:glyoxylase-like metal-dependent hydrolase (beta-lactamase superfamily II)
MSSFSRRDFLVRSTSCAAHIALAAAVAPRALRASWARPLGEVVAREPFGNLEQVADGIWAMISNPFGGDRTTLSNGGIIAGRSGVLAIEGFNQPAGAQWIAGKARELAGRWPTHVAVTHYHADHANGVAGYLSSEARPSVRATTITRDLVVQKNQPADASRTAAIEQAQVISASEPSTIDLGGRTVRIIPRKGHTASDISIEVDEPSVVFCGDLVWNGMFPNYVDAVPTELAKAVRALRRSKSTRYVPGHGALAREAEFDRYVAMLEEVETGARKARSEGKTAADAGAQFVLPASLGEWTLFNRVFFERAFAAWYRELGDRSSGIDDAGRAAARGAAWT